MGLPLLQGVDWPTSSGEGSEEEKGRAHWPARRAPVPIHSTPSSRGAGHQGCDEGTSFTFCHVHQMRLRAENEGDNERSRQNAPVQTQSAGLQRSVQYGDFFQPLRKVHSFLSPSVPVHCLPDSPLSGASMWPPRSPVLHQRTQTSFGGAAFWAKSQCFGI